VDFKSSNNFIEKCLTIIKQNVASAIEKVLSSDILDAKKRVKKSAPEKKGKGVTKLSRLGLYYCRMPVL
jgi:hypothetical protein